MTMLRETEPFDAVVPVPAGTRIAFLINSMEGGGAERAMANLLSHLLPLLDGNEVELILLDDLEQKQVLPDALKTVTLDGQGSMVQSARSLRRYWAQSGKRPDICVSYLARANVLNVAFGRFLGFRTIISERVHTSSHIAGSRARHVLAWVTRMAYPRADHIIAVGDGVADDLATNFAVPQKKLSVIGNPIDSAKLHAMAKEPSGLALPEDYFLGVGRFVPNKNFSLVLEAYADLQSDADLVLLGQGPEEEALRARATELGIAKSVHFPGFIENPYPVMASARALVSASRAEGFPNTLIEAMTVGCPVVATDCPSGPSFVLNSAAVQAPPWPDEAHGLLVPMEDTRAMTQAMRVMSDIHNRSKYAKKSAARSKDFGHEAVTSAYLNLIGSLA